MRVTHFVPYKRGKINVAKEILPELGIRNESQLYAVLLNDDEPHPTVALSIIPPSIWDRAFKLAIYLSKKPGSLNEAANIISDVGINLIASWAAATTASGEGCWTSIIELPQEYLGSEGKITKLKNEITDALQRKNVLSKSEELNYRLDPVLLNPLKVLQTLQPNDAIECQYTGRVEDYSLELRKFLNKNNKSLEDLIIYKYFIERDRGIPPYCLLTPDTEERYIRLAFLPDYLEMVQISMKLEISSESRIFKGYFGSVLESLHSLGFNLYAADNFMLAKSDPVPGSKVLTEEARFIFCADARKVRPKDLREMKKKVFGLVNSKLKRHAQNYPGSDFRLYEESLAEIETLFPRCFFATNAPKKNRKAYRTVLRIRGLALEPVNVDITVSQAVLKDVTLLLHASPIVVSLHLPKEGNQLLTLESSIEKPFENYCPSDWVLFEEAYALGLGRRVFRMRHKDVRQPRYALGQKEFVFDENNFDDALEELEKAIRRFKRTEGYYESLRASEEEAEKIPSGILRRKLDKYYNPDDP